MKEYEEIYGRYLKHLLKAKIDCVFSQEDIDDCQKDLKKRNEEFLKNEFYK